MATSIDAVPESTTEEVVLFRPSNRELSKEPRGRHFWCGCDRDLVSVGERCGVCGHRWDKGRRNKRPVPPA